MATVESIQDHDLLRSGLLNPDLDLQALSMAFAEQGRLQVEEVLRPEVAELLCRCLKQEVPWSLAFRDGKGPRKLWQEELEQLSSEDWAVLDQSIKDTASKEFSFRYQSFMMITAYKEKRNPELPLHRVVEQINRGAWLSAMRIITGINEIRRTDAQATRYTAGDFLKYHDDSNAAAKESRQVAYVLNLTEIWQADWGGLLQFIDPEGAVEETFMPRYNTLSMFRVPYSHCVSQVSDYCTGERLAITGWLHS